MPKAFQIDAEGIKMCKSLLQANGKLLIDEAISSLIPQSEWESQFADAGIKMYNFGNTQTGHLMVCEPVITDFVSQSLDTLWLVRSENPLSQSIIKQYRYFWKPRILCTVKSQLKPPKVVSEWKAYHCYMSQM